MRFSLLFTPPSFSLPALSASGQNMAFPPVALWVTIGLAVCLLVLLVALAAVCRRKIKESCEEARREGMGNKGWNWRGAERWLCTFSTRIYSHYSLVMTPSKFSVESILKIR